MSFITRCPACSTAFKVVPDQLKISDGWVRCGQCQHIFDATLDLQPWWPGLEQTTAPQTQVPQQDAAPDTSQTAPQTADPAPRQPEWGGAAPPSVPHDWRQPAAPVPGTRAAQPESSATATPPPPEPPEPPEPHWAREPEWDLPPQAPIAAAQQPPGEPRRADADWPDPTPPEASAPALAAAASMAQEPTQPQQLDPDQPQATTTAPSFVRRARRRAFWQHPLLRLLLTLLALALAALLGLQAAYQWRAPVLRELPALQPVLEAVCETLDCQQALPSGPNEVVIDSSVLLRRAPGLYVFNVVLRNQSALELASPAIELTLTDIHDQVLVRRVLLPHEWPRPTATLAPGAEWSLQFELAFDGIEGRVMTGYRAILFYP